VPSKRGFIASMGRGRKRCPGDQNRSTQRKVPPKR
jgi:hypothetical protein